MKLRTGSRTAPYMPTWLQGVVWLAALVGYFGPWIGHRAAGLAWNAYDLFDIARLLPSVESGQLPVNLQALRLPLLGLAVVLPLLLARVSSGWRWGAVVLGAARAVSTLPPYPYIVGAWRTPGWRVPFWWGVGTIPVCVFCALCARRLGKLRPWLITAVVALTGIPAFVTFGRLKPVLGALHAAPISVGWGYWLCGVSLLLLTGAAWLEGLTSFSGATVMASEKKLERVRAIKRRHEAELMRKAYVVGVGIGLDDETSDELKPVIIVSVTHKVHRRDLAPADRVPKELEGVPVEVEAIGHPKAQHHHD